LPELNGVQDKKVILDPKRTTMGIQGEAEHGESRDGFQTAAGGAFGWMRVIAQGDFRRIHPEICGRNRSYSTRLAGLRQRDCFQSVHTDAFKASSLPAA